MTHKAPLRQLHDVDETLWQNVYRQDSTGADTTLKQAMSAALLGDTKLAAKILEPASGWRAFDWPDLTRGPGLPTDEDGHIETSANFGESFLVEVSYTTDFDGRPIDPAKEPAPRTVHGPFTTHEEAESWICACPDQDDVEDYHIITLNNVR